MEAITIYTAHGDKDPTNRTIRYRWFYPAWAVEPEIEKRDTRIAELESENSSLQHNFSDALKWVEALAARAKDQGWIDGYSAMAFVEHHKQGEKHENRTENR